MANRLTAAGILTGVLIAGIAGFGPSLVRKVTARKTVAEKTPAKKAIEEIERLGGTVTTDKKARGKPVIGVLLAGSVVSDTDLEYLKELTQLQILYLEHTAITDAGLQRLKGLTQLQTLHLDRTSITGVGLEHLQELTQLQNLYLEHTAITDAGLERLKGLTQLQTLDLTDTRVTDAGVNRLKKSLPNVEIIRSHKKRTDGSHPA